MQYKHSLLYQFKDECEKAIGDSYFEVRDIDTGLCKNGADFYDTVLRYHYDALNFNGNKLPLNWLYWKIVKICENEYSITWYAYDNGVPRYEIFCVPCVPMESADIFPASIHSAKVRSGYAEDYRGGKPWWLWREG